MTDADRLVVWLRETLDAAERAANAAARRAWSPHWEYDSSVHEIRDLNNGNTLATIPFPAIGNFAAANDPAAVLRRIAADRQILDLHGNDGDGRCAVCYSVRLDGPDDDLWATEEPMTYPCTTARLLAEGYGWTEETT